MFIEFNNDKDKITERELVADILHRLKFSKEINDKDNVYFNSQSTFDDIISKLISSIPFPDKVRENYTKIELGTIHIKAGTSSGSFAIQLPPDEFHPKCVYAISQQTGMDYSDCIEQNTFNGITTFSLNVADNFINDDYIKIYVY